MRRLHLSTLLVGVNVGLLLLAVVGVAVVAVRLLQQLADEQALARVEQAGLVTRRQISSAADAMATSADLLSERPTLRRLVEQQDAAALSTFLAQFQQTSHLDGTAVVRNGQVFARSGEPLPGEVLQGPAPASATPFLHRPDTGGPLILGARATVAGLPDSAVAVVRRLDESFARQLSAEVGLPVAILERQAALATVGGPHAALRSRALDTNSLTTGRLDNLGTYVAVVPLQAPSGDIVGLIETALPTASVTQSLQQFVATLLLLALGVAAVAGLASLLLGRRLGRPLRALTHAAARIGRGDLATPVAVAPGAEIGSLAATLEEMRWRLLRLTDDLRRQQAEAQAIVTGIVEGVYSVDRERRFRYLNPQAAAMLGTTPDRAIGQFCGDVLRPQGPGGVRPCEEHCPIIHARFRGGARAT
ncbi:MAG: HAMP domain-containing protein, partial [Chloroflexota bacterium]|nr:HAMP domain-containing protein [Chloroflexota bacterium]